MKLKTYLSKLKKKRIAVTLFALENSLGMYFFYIINCSTDLMLLAD